MAWKRGAAFTGSSGQAAVMSELLFRHCNVAVPHVDMGMDIFAFQDEREDVARIQVKTAQAVPYRQGDGYSAKFGIPLQQLERTDNPPLFYALAVRLEEEWERFLVISRTALQELQNKGCGAENRQSGNLELHIQFREEAADGRDHILRATCAGIDLSAHLDNWQALPPLKTPMDIPLEGNQA